MVKSKPSLLVGRQSLSYPKIDIFSHATKAESENVFTKKQIQRRIPHKKYQTYPIRLRLAQTVHTTYEKLIQFF